MSLSQLENRQKATFCSEFDSYVRSKNFKSAINELNLNDYKFEIAKINHFDEILHLICTEQIRRNESSGDHDLLSLLNPNQLKEFFKYRINYVLNTGTMVIVLNEHNKIVSCHGILDFVNNVKSHVKQNSTHNSNYSYVHFLEIYDKCSKDLQNTYFKNDKIYKQILNNNETNIGEIYGKYCELTLAATKINYSKKGFI
eukprot:284723_1